MTVPRADRSNRGPLDEYQHDYRGEDYWTLLRAAATSDGAPETIAGQARLLGCGRMHADTVATNLCRKALIMNTWDGERRAWRLRATAAGVALLSVSDEEEHGAA